MREKKWKKGRGIDEIRSDREMKEGRQRTEEKRNKSQAYILKKREITRERGNKGMIQKNRYVRN